MTRTVAAIPHALALGIIFALAACTPADNTRAVYTLASGLTAANVAALGYLGQPPCAGASKPTCVDPGVKARIKATSMQAYLAVKAAEASAAKGDSTQLVAAHAAVAGLIAIIPTR